VLSVKRCSDPVFDHVIPLPYGDLGGYANDWHFVHLGSRAVGGAGLVLTEAAAVLPEGRITPQDLGIWSDDHVEPLARIVRFLNEQGSVAGMQLAHAGRKASTYRPWDGNGAVAERDGGWAKVVAPSALRFVDDYPLPQALTVEGIEDVIAGFAAAARRAWAAGFRVVELHAAHGYLIHEFLSPLSNTREDRYGGSFENRTRLLRDTVTAAGRKLETASFKLDAAQVAKYIDRGQPIIWSMYSTEDYNQLADARTRARGAATDAAAWKKTLAESRKGQKPLKPEREKGHVCMIMGYNKETGEIAVSDSWGPKFEERWVLGSEAAQVSQGEMMVIGF
jgi:2,4-dienoyl-CoA reductase-like NADH-dependent reductase (Old Yellow Enzyme family)